MNIPPDLITLVVTLVGGSGGLGYLFKAYLDYKSGVSNREKEFNKEVIDSLKNTKLKLEAEVEFRMACQQYASELRGMLLEMGVDRDDIPTPPEKTTTI